MEKKNIYTTDDVCELYGVTRRSVYRWIRSGKLDAHKVGRRNYFTPEEVFGLIGAKPDDVLESGSDGK